MKVACLALKLNRLEKRFCAKTNKKHPLADERKILTSEWPLSQPPSGRGGRYSAAPAERRGESANRMGF